MRSFDITTHQRDDALDAPLKAREASAYHPKTLATAKEHIAKVDAMSTEECAQAAQAEYEAVKKRLEESIEKTQQQRASLETALEQAHAFIPPTNKHKNLKNVMVQELEDTIRFDCDASHLKEQLANLKPLSGEEWHAEQMKAINFERCNRLNRSNIWVQQAIEAIEATAKKN